jgi:hypothetical protein
MDYLRILYFKENLSGLFLLSIKLFNLIMHGVFPFIPYFWPDLGVYYCSVINLGLVWNVLPQICNNKKACRKKINGSTTLWKTLK